MNDRGRVQVTDVVTALSVVVALLYLSPAFGALVSELQAEVGPLTTILLSLIVPSIAFGIVISIGVSASRRTGDGS